MHTLLTAIQDILQNLPQLPRKSDCYVTPHVNYMPTGTRLPCLGLKDGGINRAELAGEMAELSMKVLLVGFVNMKTDGGKVMSEIYELLDDATAMLVGADLGIAGMAGPDVGPDSPSEMFLADNKQWIVKLVRTLTYTVDRASA